MSCKSSNRIDFGFYGFYGAPTQYRLYGSKEALESVHWTENKSHIETHMYESESFMSCEPHPAKWQVPQVRNAVVLF